MPTVDTIRRVAAAKNAYDTVRPVAERLARDEELRKHAKRAISSARVLYSELGTEGTPRAIATRLAADAELQQELRRTAEELRKIADRAKRSAQQKKSHARRNTVFLIAGVVITALYNPLTGPDTRRWLREKAFGPEETFEYEA
jgi:hypothetical protein